MPSPFQPHAIGGLQEPSQQKPQPSASAKPTPTPKKPESVSYKLVLYFHCLFSSIVTTSAN